MRDIDSLILLSLLLLAAINHTSISNLKKKLSVDTYETQTSHPEGSNAKSGSLVNMLIISITKPKMNSTICLMETLLKAVGRKLCMLSSL